ncbi:MAG: ABC transporter substrate-binding protein [Clostridiales bacterium]|nr:ABC transporter substrate-binding protein [Clostridiales bacterium]
MGMRKERKRRMRERMKATGKKRIASILAGLLAISLAIAGCGGEENADKNGDSSVTASSGADAEGSSDSVSSDSEKTLIFATSQTCSTLDPANEYDSWYTVRYGVGQTLTQFDDEMTAQPWLIEDYDLSEDNLTWTFTIRDDVTFSNGNPLTAEAVKSSLERVFAESNRAASFFEYEEMTASGQTLTITTKTPCANMLGMLADPLFVIIDTSVDLEDIADVGPIGTGPYVFSSFDVTSHECKVVKNEQYWGGDVPLDEVTFQMFDDSSTQSYAMQAGEVDAAYNVGMNEIDQFKDNADYTVSECVGGRTDFGFINQSGVLSDLTLRQAIIRAADRETYCTYQLNGAFAAGSAPLASSLDYGFVDLIDENSYDVESANALLDEAGYVDVDGDGYREDTNGNAMSIKLVTYTTRPELGTIAEAYQTSLEEVGIALEVQTTDSDTCYNILETGEGFDIMLLNINAVSTGDPENFFYSYFVTPTENNQNYNTFGYSNETFDSIMETLSDTFDTEERKQLIVEAQQILMDDACCIYFCYPIMNLVSKDEVTGFVSNPADYYWLTENVDTE